MTEKWYDISPALLTERLKTNLSGGLSKAEAEKRFRKYGANSIYPIPKGPFKMYLHHLLTDFTSALLLITAVLAAIFERYVGSVVMICLLFLNIAAAVFTYVKAQRVLEDMGKNALPTAKVIRSGKLYIVRQEQLVVGDVVFLSAGDIVPADCRLLESDGLYVLENNLTGEIRSSKKDASFIEYRDIPISARKNMVYAATIVTSGTARAVVCDTGEDTLVCAMGKNTAIVTHDNLSVLSTLKSHCKIMSLAMLGLILLLTILDLILGNSSRELLDIFLCGLALAVAAMSEFYTAFGYIIISCGIFSAVKRYKDINSGAMIKNAESLESLRDLSCLIVPREALMTVRLSEIDRVYADGETVDSTMRNFAEASKNVLRYAVISTGIYGEKRLAANNLTSNNVYRPDEETIIRAADSIGIYNTVLDRTYPLVEHRSVDAHNRFDTSLARFSGGHVIAIRGDAVGVLNCCRYYSEKGRVHPLTPEKLNELRLVVSQTERKAYRVIAVATRTTEYNNLRRIYAMQSDMTFEGFICVREPLLPGAALNIEKCIEAGIKVIMTTPDVRETNRCVAAALGIIKSDDEAVTAKRLRDLKEGLYRLNTTSLYRLYEGVTDDDMRKVVACLKENGEKVGILSRGLDDIILTRDADVAFAQSVTISPKADHGSLDAEALSSAKGRGIPIRVKDSSKSSASGCEAVKFISDVIVSEPNQSGSGGFNAMIGAVGCAKVIYLNMLRTLRYLLASQSSRLLIVLASIIGTTTLFSPVQLLFCGLILDFGAVIVMAFERPERDILRSKSDAEAQLKKPLRHCIDSIFFGVIWAVVTIALPYILSAFGIMLNAAQISSVTFICSAFTQLAVLAEIKRDKTIFRSFSFNGVQMVYASVVVMITLVGLLFPSFGLMFGIVRIPVYAFIGAMALPLISILIFELYRLALPSLKPAIKAFNERGGVVSVFSAGFKVDDISDDERYTEEEILNMASEDEIADSENEQTDVAEEKSDLTACEEE